MKRLRACQLGKLIHLAEPKIDNSLNELKLWLKHHTVDLSLLWTHPCDWPYFVRVPEGTPSVAESRSTLAVRINKSWQYKSDAARLYILTSATNPWLSFSPQQQQPFNGYLVCLLDPPPYLVHFVKTTMWNVVGITEWDCEVERGLGKVR